MVLELLKFVGGALLIVLDLLQFPRNPSDERGRRGEEASPAAGAAAGH